MGYNQRNDEIRDDVTRMRRVWEAERGALATVRRFNAILPAKGYSWFWPKVAAAIIAKHPWLVIACDSCGSVVDLDLRVMPRDPEASIPRRASGRALPALQRAWEAAHYRRCCASVDMMGRDRGHSGRGLGLRPRANLTRSGCSGPSR